MSGDQPGELRQQASDLLRPGQIQGLPVLQLHTAHGSIAISLHGGQVLSYLPAGHDEVFWVSPISQQVPHAIRGGVPVCWPYFGRQGQPADVTQHGFARTSTWQLRGQPLVTDDGVTLALVLPAHKSTKLRLTQTLHLGAVLQQSLVTRNDGQEAVHFTQALHGYFQVGDATRVQLEGVAGLHYADKYDGGQHLQSGEWNLHDPRDPGRSDRIYQRAGGHYTLADPVKQRRISVQTSGSDSLVVWNPGEAGIAAIIDAPADGWRHFICVEPANAGQDVITLAPGETHTLQQTINVLPL